VLRPLLIKQGGADLPILLIFVGVIGGLISFGLIGIFVGPLVLAVTHTLLDEWVTVDAATAGEIPSGSPDANNRPPAVESASAGTTF